MFFTNTWFHCFTGREVPLDARTDRPCKAAFAGGLSAAVAGLLLIMTMGLHDEKASWEERRGGQQQQKHFYLLLGLQRIAAASTFQNELLSKENSSKSNIQYLQERLANAVRELLDQPPPPPPFLLGLRRSAQVPWKEDTGAESFYPIWKPCSVLLNPEKEEIRSGLSVVGSGKGKGLCPHFKSAVVVTASS
jgi:hypothetical protein